VTGLDLVELQIRIAAGEALPIGQNDVPISGHAIEARLYAEAPHKGFLPQPGQLVAWRPPCGLGVRVDHGLNPSQAITPYYDPMLAKIIATGASREEARRRLVVALEDTIAFGVTTNRAFLIEALSHPEFVAGRATTQFIGKHFAKIAPPAADPALLGLAAVLWFEASAQRYGHDSKRAWSSSGAISWPLELETGGKKVACAVAVRGPDRYGIDIEGGALEIGMTDDGDGAVRFRTDGQERSADYVFAGGRLHLKCGAADLMVRETLYEPRAGAGGAGSTETEVRAPMNGKVVAVLVNAGDVVAKGQRLVMVEAMKMQHEMAAGGNGTVTRVTVKPGDQVATRQLLVEIKPAG
jgi:geranyl-CoA carboxylase alpha subunit